MVSGSLREVIYVFQRLKGSISGPFKLLFVCMLLDKIAAISIIFLRNGSDLIKFWEKVSANACYLYGFALKNFNLQHE